VDEEFDPEEEGQDPESEETPAESAAADPAKLAKLQKENRSLRGRLRRAELGAEYGKDIAELVPDALPLKEWDAYAEKLVALRGQTGKEETPPEGEAPAEPPTEAEQKLAVVSSASSAAAAGSDNPYRDMSAKEIGLLPEGERERAMAAKYVDSL
jgi:hypothetical protein